MNWSRQSRVSQWRGSRVSQWRGYSNISGIQITLVVVILVSLIFMVVDCSVGTTKYFKCQVSRHHYEPSYDSHSTDSDGYTTTTHHSEEFHVICESLGTEDRTIDVETDRDRYESTQDGQIVWVKARCGRWTDGAYLPKIQDYPPTAEK